MKKQDWKIPKPYDQVVKVGEGWVDLESVLQTICRVAK
jgi:hypothetical protein